MAKLDKVVVTSSPHIKSPDSTTTIMADVILALMPALVIAFITFGARTLTLTATCIITCVVSEMIFNKINKQESTISDLTAVITGLLLAYNLPVSLPLWTAVIGSAFAIIIVKMIFGGLGQNFINPALGGRMFLLSWTALMTTWTAPGYDLPLFATPVDVVTSATPMAEIKAGLMPTASLSEMFFGQIGGTLGETSALALLLGLGYMLFRKVITITIPASYIGTVFVIALIFSKGHNPFEFALAHILGGGLMLGAIFMATDYSTSPVTQKGQLIFGIGCGLITMFIRYFGSYAEGVSFAIVIMNALVFLIDKYTLPKRFGAPVKVKKSKKEEASA